MRKKRILLLLLVISLMAIAVTFVFSASAEESASDNESATSELEVYFFDHEKRNIGDSFIIRYGDIQILVDAGPDAATAETIKMAINHSISGSDELWDYVIVTHPDTDHIGAFSTNVVESNDFGVLKHLKEKGGIGMLIDFEIEDRELAENSFASEKNKNYTQYAKRRDSYCVPDENGESVIQSYVTAAELTKNGAHEIEVADDLTLVILDNYFYDDGIAGKSKLSSAEKNCLSVCFMLVHGDQKLLFTGDLEEYDSGNGYAQIYGETKLYELNEKYLSGGVDFFKAGHHGSKTSNCKEFIDKIHPNYIYIPVVAGTKEKTVSGFPQKEVMQNFLSYTDHIFMPSIAIYEEDAISTTWPTKIQKYYGEVKIFSDGRQMWASSECEVGINGEPKPITETAWLKNNFDIPFSTYVFDTNGIYGDGQCVLLKYGSIEILIDCGINARESRDTNSDFYISDVSRYCVDGVLEYVIVTHPQTDALSQMDEIIENFKIVNLIDFGSNVSSATVNAKGGWYNTYRAAANQALSQRDILNYYGDGKKDFFSITEGLSLKLFNIKPTTCDDENDYSISVLVNYYDKKLLFTSDLTNGDGGEDRLNEEAGGLIKGVSFFIASDGARDGANSPDLVENIAPRYVVISAAGGMQLPGGTYVSRQNMDNFKQLTSGKSSKKNGQTYLMSEIKNNKVSPVTGDIVFILIDPAGPSVEIQEIAPQSIDFEETPTMVETDYYKNAA